MFNHFIRTTFLIIFSALLSLSCIAFAEDFSKDINTRFEKYYINYNINNDGSFTEERKWSMKVLNDRALESAKETSITYSTSIQTASIIEAYTVKANGKKILVPKSSYQITANGGKDKNKAIFSDRTTLRLIFPLVEVGDSVYLNYRLNAKEPIYPGQFSESENFYKTDAYDDVKISINAPLTLKLNTQLREFKEDKNYLQNDRHILEWSWQNSAPIINERKDYSVYNGDEDPGYLISTFNSEEEIAKAYGLRAIPKALPSARVKVLAEEIAKGKNTDNEIARSLYDWVATNITYAGNCVGLGAVVPHDLDFILDNKMGDCKDHATLLQALLSAKNIQSTQALISSGSAYELPKIPVVSMVNHVINYIPTMDLFLDSTSNSTPYGMLPFGDQEKPVLLVEGYKAGFKTPSQKVGENTQTLKSIATIYLDGSIQGESTVSSTGSFASDMRSAMRNLSHEQEKNIIKNNFNKSSSEVKGTFTRDDPKPLLNTYNYSANYEVKNLYTFTKSGAIGLYPLFYSYGPISNVIAESKMEVSKFKITCSSLKSSEELIFTFPDNIQIISVPDNLEISNETITYSASYKLDKNKLTINRIIDDKTVGNLCSPEIMVENNRVLLQAYENYTEQLVYKKLKIKYD